MDYLEKDKTTEKYDVFLSFRGEDTRNNILSHLQEALFQKQVHHYIDNDIGKGDEISLSLIKAIEASFVSIVIFSENYASSKWCLDEINKIVECKKERNQVVIPVFFKIDPSDVRKQSGSYEQAFEKHKRDLKQDIDRVQKWKDSLAEVASLARWDSRNYRSESEFIKNIVKDVLQILYRLPQYPNPGDFDLTVGIGKSCAGIESLLHMGTREILMIGIWGMAGIGKTTLAKALYDKLSSQFEGRCFLNIANKPLNVLRKQLFSELLQENLDAPMLESNFLVTRLRRKRVLIVLDDVTSSQQIDDIINDYYYLGPGSRVIVTTRDEGISSQVDDIYEVNELNLRDSRKLFCLCVFRQRRPKEGYEELSERVIALCQGIPLVIMIMGHYLRGKSESVWKYLIHTILRRGFGDFWQLKYISDPLLTKKLQEVVHQNMQNENEDLNENSS